MKKFTSINYSSAAFNIAMLLLRICFAGMLFKHGLDKLQHFSTYEPQFYSFLGLGNRVSLVLAIFAEVFCSLFVLIGLFTRLTVVPIIITMLVATYVVSSSKSFLDAELSIVFLCAFVVLLFCGPGKISVDGMMNK